jgi:hypothetical protein
VRELDAALATAILATMVDDRPLRVAKRELSIGKGCMAKLSEMPIAPRGLGND